MLICKGDGELLINPETGDVTWEEVCSAALRWCHEKGYKSVDNLEASLNLDSCEIPLPECTECPEYERCCDEQDCEDDELDNTYCLAIDEEATKKSILTALSALDEDERLEVLGENIYYE